MAYTKATLRTALQEQADASGSTRWSTTASTGEVDRIASMVFDREWKRILNANPFYRMSKRTPTSNSTTGRIALTALDGSSGDTKERFYRVITLARNNIIYSPMDHSDFILGEDVGSQDHVWFRDGSNIMMLPKETNVTFNVWVNWIPQRPSGLSADSITVDFPEDYEEILRYEGAGWMLTKGGAETREAAEMWAMADVIRADMLQDIGRISIEPQYFKYSDRALDWGGR